MQYDERMAAEQRAYNRAAGDAFMKLTSLPEWKYVKNYLEARGNNLMQAILAPSVGADGMTIALSAERSKGALAEINSFAGYIDAIIKQNTAEEKKSAGEIPDSQVPGVDRIGPQNEADAAGAVAQPGA